MFQRIRNLFGAIIGIFVWKKQGAERMPSAAATEASTGESQTIWDASVDKRVRVQGLGWSRIGGRTARRISREFCRRPRS